MEKVTNEEFTRDSVAWGALAFALNQLYGMSTSKVIAVVKRKSDLNVKVCGQVIRSLCRIVPKK